MPEPQKKTVPQLVEEAIARGDRDIELDDAQADEAEEYLKNRVRIPTDPVPGLVEEAQRTGEFVSPGAAGIGAGLTGQGGGRVGPYTSFGLGAVNALSAGLAPSLQGRAVSLLSQLTDQPLTPEQASRRSEIEQAAAEQAFSMPYHGGQTAARIGLGFLPPLGLAAIGIPAWQAALEAPAKGENPLIAGPTTAAAGLGGMAVLGGLGSVLGRAFAPGRQLAREAVEAAAPTAQRLYRSTGGQLNLPGMGPRTLQQEVEADLIREAEKAITPTPEMLDPNVLIRSRSEGDVSRLMDDLYHEGVIPNRPMGMRSHLETVPPPSRAGRVATPLESADTAPPPRQQVELPTEIDEPTLAAQLRETQAGTRPAAAGRLMDTPLVQGTERFLRGSVLGGALGNPLLGLVAGGAAGALPGKLSPLLTAPAMLASGAVGKTAEFLSRPLSGVLSGLVAEGPPQKPSPENFATAVLDTPELRQEARTILDANPSNRARAHSVLMERSPRYRQAYMRWAAEQNR